MSALNRVALVVPAFEQGGGVPSVAMFIRRAALASGRFAVSVVSLATSRRDPASLQLMTAPTWLSRPRTVSGDWSGIPFVHVGANLAEFEFQRYRPRAVLGRALADCDLIQLVSGSPAWANAVIGLGRPVAVHVATRARIERRVRDAHPRTLAGWWRRGMTAITDHMDDRALSRVDAIQAMNPWMLDYARNLNRSRDVDIRFAPPGVDAQHFKPLPGVARLQDPYILCVGRLNDPRKNVSLLLDAYSRLPTALRDRVRLVLAGSSAPPLAFWQRAEQLQVRDRVSFVAKPDNVALLDLYQRSSVFALPSDEEGFGVVILEAMACGVPAIATLCGGPDGIVTDGEDGYLVARGDADAMTARLASLLAEPGRNAAMGAAARLTIERRYDERVTGSVFLDMWDRLLHKPGTP